MDVLPAIDLRHGRVVRLRQGDAARETVYADDPAAVAARFVGAGARLVHVVDLDAAFGEAPQRDLVVAVLAAVRAASPAAGVQLGGGLRDAAAVEWALAAGCARVVLGSLPARDPQGFADLARAHPGRLVPAVEAAGDEPRVAGWTRGAGRTMAELCAPLRGLPCPAVLVTDIERDGMERGPNLGLALTVAAATGLPALLSGGVRTPGDLAAAAAHPEIAGVILGRALYAGEIDFAAALAAAAASHGAAAAAATPALRSDGLDPRGSTPRPAGQGAQTLAAGEDAPDAPEAAAAGPTGLTRRVIPCLDVAAGRVVKGVRFRDLVEVGDPAEAAARYARQGADEIVFLDIGAAPEGRGSELAWVERTAERVFIPLTVGGGVRSVEDAARLLRAGADKVAVNTAAVRRPELLDELARQFGSQCVVLSIDALRRPDGGGWEVVVGGGRTPTGLDVLQWLRDGVAAGAGEVLLTSIDCDGTRGGYDLALLAAAVRAAAPVPLIASGGAGEPAHLASALAAGAAAVLAASIFHQGTHTVGEVKRALAAAGFTMREEAA